MSHESSFRCEICNRLCSMSELSKPVRGVKARDSICRQCMSEIRAGSGTVIRDAVRYRKERKMAADPCKSYITVHRSVSGWRAVLLTWSGERYSPRQAGIGIYPICEQAEAEACDWAASEDVGLKP